MSILEEWENDNLSKKNWKWYDHVQSWFYQRIFNPISDLKFRFIRNCYRFKRGWAPSDTWNFCGYLSKIISEGSKHLRDNGHVMIGKDENDTWRILDYIKWTFQIAEKYCEGEVYYIPSKTKSWYLEYYKIKQWHDEANKRFNQNVKVLNYQETRNYEKGLKLFQKHFFDLID